MTTRDTKWISALRDLRSVDFYCCLPETKSRMWSYEQLKLTIRRPCMGLIDHIQAHVKFRCSFPQFVIFVFIHSLNKYLWSVCSVPITSPEHRKAAANKTEVLPYTAMGRGRQANKHSTVIGSENNRLWRGLGPWDETRKRKDGVGVLSFLR